MISSQYSLGFLAVSSQLVLYLPPCHSNCISYRSDSANMKKMRKMRKPFPVKSREISEFYQEMSGVNI